MHGLMWTCQTLSCLIYRHSTTISLPLSLIYNHMPNFTLDAIAYQEIRSWFISITFSSLWFYSLLSTPIWVPDLKKKMIELFFLGFLWNFSKQHPNKWRFHRNCYTGKIGLIKRKGEGPKFVKSCCESDMWKIKYSQKRLEFVAI